MRKPRSLPAKSSGQISTSKSVFVGPAILWGVEATHSGSGTNPAIVTVTDSENSTLTGKTKASQVYTNHTQRFGARTFKHGIACSRGLYVSVNGAQTKGVIHYTALPV